MQILLQTQATKHPYQFNAYLARGSRRLDIGIVVGDIAATSNQPDSSRVQLHLYRGIGPLVAMMIVVVFCVYMSYQGLSSITNPSRDESMRCISLLFAALGVGSLIGFLWAWYRAEILHLFSTHLLKLNSMPRETTAAMMPPEADL